MNEIMVQNAELASDVGETDEVSWTAPVDMTYEQWSAIGRTFQQINRSLALWVGDWLNEGERRWGEMYTQAIEDTGRSVETLMKYKSVSQRVPRDIRRKELTWTHLFYVAYVDDDQKRGLLDLAVNMDLSSRELKEIVKLDWARREDVMMVAQEDISKDELMRLVNKFKLGLLDAPVDDEEKDCQAEETPFSDPYDDDDEEFVEDRPSLSLDAEIVQDFWENQGVPLKFVGQSEAIWEGMAVRAGRDEEGRLILIWEEIP